jgi:hypothetical protein
VGQLHNADTVSIQCHNAGQRAASVQRAHSLPGSFRYYTLHTIGCQEHPLRALKNALNRTYGAPGLKEIARESWMVAGTETTPEERSCIPPRSTVPHDAPRETTTALRRRLPRKRRPPLPTMTPTC